MFEFTLTWQAEKTFIPCLDKELGERVGVGTGLKDWKCISWCILFFHVGLRGMTPICARNKTTLCPGARSTSAAHQSSSLTWKKSDFTLYNPHFNSNIRVIRLITDVWHPALLNFYKWKIFTFQIYGDHWLVIRLNKCFTFGYYCIKMGLACEGLRPFHP